MEPQRHIINKQILEIHIPEDSDLSAMQTAVGQVYYDKIIPIIQRICDSHSAAGTQCKIERLTVDLGEISLEEFETQFGDKFAQAMASQPVEAITGPPAGMGNPSPTQSPVEMIAYYLLTGTLPWWAPAPTKSYLQEVMGQLLSTPNQTLEAILRQVAQTEAYRTRFVQTFSETQVLQALGILSDFPAETWVALKRQMAKEYPHKTSQQLANAFWTAAFMQIGLTTSHADLASQTYRQTLQRLAVDLISVSKGKKVSSGIQAQMAIEQQAKQIQQNLSQLPQVQRFIQQLSRILHHPLFPSLAPALLAKLSDLLNQFQAAQQTWLQNSGSPAASSSHTSPEERKLLAQTLAEAHLGPLGSHLQLLESQLRHIALPRAPKVMETLVSAFDETDAIALNNAGLVLFWPFLPRFFSNLGLIAEKKFISETAQYKAAALLQYIAAGEEEGIFEGLLSLNKILCGINLDEAVVLEPLTDEEKEMAEGLMQAVIAQGPHWKNLSIGGLRTSYLQREGLLRNRDGHWFLQVKKETHDITLTKLPWSFSSVKLPWMNQLMMIEWI